MKFLLESHDILKNKKKTKTKLKEVCLARISQLLHYLFQHA